MSTPAEVGGLAEEFLGWLRAFLPHGYDPASLAGREDWALRRDYQAALFDSGWLQPHWEPALGGRSLTPADSLIVRLVEARSGAPKLYALGSVHVAAPTIRAHGTEEQKARWLVPALRGDERWCLGMSEPEAGSDLASLRTRGRIEGDDVVVDGRKIWTSQAHWARWCLLYCRTDPDAAKHRGLSCVGIDMDADGITVAPIRMADESTEQFCEVDFTAVRMPRSNVIGSLGAGWSIVTAALTDERDMLWLMNYAALLRVLGELPPAVAAAPDYAASVGSSLADALAVRAAGLRARQRQQSSLPNPEFLILKLFGSQALLRAWDLVEARTGQVGLPPSDFFLAEMEALSAGIYGGTSEIQRDIIGERALGLPRQR